MTQEQGTSSSDLPYPAWQPEYRAALLELDPNKLRELVQAAEEAIFNRLQQLARNSNSQDNKAERLAIEDALANIRVLQRDKLGFPDWKKE